RPRWSVGVARLDGEAGPPQRRLLTEPQDEVLPEPVEEVTVRTKVQPSDERDDPVEGEATLREVHARAGANPAEQFPVVHVEIVEGAPAAAPLRPLIGVAACVVDCLIEGHRHACPETVRAVLCEPPYRVGG